MSVLGSITCVLLAAAVVGCGADSGVESGAEVAVYAEAPLCAGAKGQLVARGSEAGEVKVRVSCFGRARRNGRLDLAAIGAGARRAVEDSTSVAYLARRGPATDFSRPILNEAEIDLITKSSGADAMAQVLDALEARASDEAPRESVWAGR